jgi:hypothetical protein
MSHACVRLGRLDCTLTNSRIAEAWSLGRAFFVLDGCLPIGVMCLKAYVGCSCTQGSGAQDKSLRAYLVRG